MRNFNDDDLADIKTAFLKRDDVADLAAEEQEAAWQKQAEAIKKLFSYGTVIAVDSLEEAGEFAEGVDTVIDMDRMTHGPKFH